MHKTTLVSNEATVELQPLEASIKCILDKEIKKALGLTRPLYEQGNLIRCNTNLEQVATYTHLRYSFYPNLLV